MYSVDIPIYAPGFFVGPLFYQNKIISAFFFPYAVKKTTFSEKLFPHKEFNTVSNTIQNLCKQSG